MIVHLIQRDKFTNGYIRFMLLQFPEIRHIFFTKNGIFSLDKVDNNQIFEVDNFGVLFTKQVYLQLIERADKIIVSGVWLSFKDIWALIPNGYLTANKFFYKTYFHFWGGDFYIFRLSDRSIIVKIVRIIKKRLLSYALRKSAGLIFLIDGEYEKFQEIMHISNRHFVAPMPGDHLEQINFAKFRKHNSKNDDAINIIIGNSAAPSNHHKEVFHMLLHLSNSNIRVYCPLSYGDKQYGEEVAKMGTEFFGNKFFPIFDFMDRDLYLDFLAKMDIGIFFNDRQQAMGNIFFLFALGKKVFLRTGTSMWYHFLKRGLVIFPADELNTISLENFSKFSDEDMAKNILLSEEFFLINKAKQAWDAVFESEVN